MKPKFITFDGVELLSSDRVYFCFKTGKTPNNVKDICNTCYVHEFIPAKSFNFYSFSTKEACQAYIDKMNLPVIFTTQDGVDIRVGDEYWCVAEGPYGPFLCDENSMYYQGGPYFSTEAKAQEYLDSLSKPVVFTTNDGVDVKLGDLYYCVANDCIYGPYICNEHCTCNQNGPYFLTREKAQEYINSLKPVETTVIEPAESKSELELAYDKLTALCAKYLNGSFNISIYKKEAFPVNRTRYQIIITDENFNSFYKGHEIDDLEDGIVLFHSYAISVCNNLD